MAKDIQDKPIDETQGADESVQLPIQTEDKQKLAAHVQELFRGAYNAKIQMDLMTTWALCDDYIHNIQNEPETEEDPGSVTNIIKPIIDSEISDIIDKPYSVDALGREPGDHMFADDVEHALQFVLDRNQYKVKLTMSEHDRLELGTTIVKVYTDEDALNGRGLPTFDIISPANFFPDPKWTAAHLLQDCEFIIHAVPRPLSYIRRQFPEMGKYVKRSISWMYDPTLDIETMKTDEVAVATSQKALLIECYMRDENGDIFCVHVANNIVLEDSREKKIVGKKLQRRNLFPFEVIVCYPRRGTGWGMGDVEYLFPTQDLINDMDDQIRMAARLMGNPQVAISLMGVGKGFDARKWTNKPGLRIPMRDVNSFKMIDGANISSDIPARREKAFEEANIISGRPDVNRGQTPGQGVTAASAIIALQQAGQKTVVHKTEMLKQGWTEVLELLYDEMRNCWNEGMWIRINGQAPDFKFIDPSQLSKVPIMVPNLEATPDNGQDTVKQLMNTEPMTDDDGNPMLDDEGNQLERAAKPMTRDAEFDLQLNLGNGLPTDKAFVYQTLLDLAKLAIGGQPVISWQELRNYLRNQVGIPLQADSVLQQQQPQQPSMQGPPGMPGQPQGLPPGAPQPPQGMPTPAPSPAMIPGQLRVMQGGAPAQ